MKKIIIIGAGASGMISAINAKNDNNEVILLEKNSDCGKKILATGNGRCNYYNEDQDINHYHSTSNNISEFITEERINEILPFFTSLGIYPDIKDGYYYPKSNQAISIRNALELECINKGVKIIKNEDVLEVKKEDRFIVKTNNNKYDSDILVIAAGSKASPKTGSDGKGYEFAKSFGHTIIKPLPGLVQLISNDKLCEASGVRVKVKLKLIENDNFIKEEIGELQITDYGISGIVAMQLSSFISRGLDENKKEEIIINFLPGVNIKDFIEDLSEKLSNRTISELLDPLINYKLVNAILKISNISKDEYYNNLSTKQKEDLINNLENYKITIEDTKGFDNAQICTGGISLLELNSDFESKLVNDLYFTGEIIDINGDCGGYNLSFAWLSGITVGNTIKKKTN